MWADYVTWIWNLQTSLSGVILTCEVPWGQSVWLGVYNWWHKHWFSFNKNIDEETLINVETESLKTEHDVWFRPNQRLHNTQHSDNNLKCGQWFWKVPSESTSVFTAAAVRTTLWTTMNQITSSKWISQQETLTALTQYTTGVLVLLIH